jgi:hypothetical protein
VIAVTPKQAADRADVDFAIGGVTDNGELDVGFGTPCVVPADVARAWPWHDGVRRG